MCVHALLLRRGFGFVTYVDQTGVDKVLAQNRHELDSKTVSFFLFFVFFFPNIICVCVCKRVLACVLSGSLLHPTCVRLVCF